MSPPAVPVAAPAATPPPAPAGKAKKSFKDIAIDIVVKALMVLALVYALGAIAPMIISATSSGLSGIGNEFSRFGDAARNLTSGFRNGVQGVRGFLMEVLVVVVTIGISILIIKFAFELVTGKKKGGGAPP
jgi:hypothetical protein